MSMIDFNQEAKDQGCLHIALKSVGGAGDGLVKAVGKVLANMPPIQLQGTVLFLRFLDGDQLPCWAAGEGTKVRVRWDQFSAHKCIHGLLCVARCQDADDLDNARAGYKNLRETHKFGLCSSKCILYGPRKGLRPDTELKDGMIHIDSTLDELDVLVEDVKPPIVEKVASELAQTIFISLRSKMEGYLKLVGEPGLRTDPLPQLKAPVDTSEDESERQLSRAHLLGRLQKQLADLCLLIGQLQQAGRWYRSASEELKHHKDWLWVGGAFEGLSVTALMTKECERVLGQKAQGVDVPSTLAILRGKYATARATSRVLGGSSPGGSVIANHSVRSTQTLDMRRNKTDPTLSAAGRSATARRPAAKSPSPTDTEQRGEEEGSKSLVIANDPERDQEEEGAEGEEAGFDDTDADRVLEDLGKDDDDTLSLLVDRRLLHKDFIVDTFSLAQVYFRKAGRRGAVVHMESLLKFSRYLVSQKRLVKAADTLQKTLRVQEECCNLPADQFTHYQTMASIYESMGFHRKAAMFSWYAARSANGVGKNQFHFYHKAHDLLVSTLPGYRLSRDMETLPTTRATHIGWPKLQAVVLTDFVFQSHKLGEDLAVINHACYLLELLHQHMDSTRSKNITSILEQVVKEAKERCETTPSYAASVAGKLVSPIPLTHFPFVRSFYPRPLIKIMAPHRRAKATPTTKGLDVGGTREKKEGPFIYSPFGPGRKKAQEREEVLWVEKDPAEIAISIFNPLPFELRVENMALLVEGSQIEIFPSSLTLPGGAEQSQFALVSIPHDTGLVTVKGYEATVFGVYHKCEVKIPGDPLIRVIPQMPLLQVRSFPGGVAKEGAESGVAVEEKGEGGRRLSQASVDKFDLLDGESCQFCFKLKCNEMVTLLTAGIKKQEGNFCQFLWDEDVLTSMLPLPPNSPASLPVTIRACIPTNSRLFTSATPTTTATPPSSSSSPASGPTVGTEILAIPASPLREMVAPYSSFSGRATPVDDATTPNSSPVIKRSQRKTSNHLDGGVDRAERRASSSLMDSLHLDPPQLGSRTSSTGGGGSSSTLPSGVAGRFSPGSGHKTNSLLRSGFRKPKGGGSYSKTSGLSYNDVIFGLDKRASVRSDPGDRDHGGGSGGGKSRLGKFRVGGGGGSNYTSPTSSVTALLPEPSQPISIPHTSSHLAHDIATSSSPASKESLVKGGQHQQLARNASLQVKGSRGHTPITKGNISLPKGPLYKEVATKSNVTGVFGFEYSGEAGAAEGYYRQVEASVYVTIRTCLLFEQFDVCNCEKSQELFQLKFVMHNFSSLQLKVTCKVDQAGLAECGGTAELVESLAPSTHHKCCLLLRKFNLDSDTSDSPGTKTDIHRSKQYSKKLLEMLTVEWEVEGGGRGSGRHGTLTLEGIPFPAASIPLMRPLPVLFSVKLDNHLCPPTETAHSCDLQVGSLLRALIRFTNNSPSAMPASFLVLEPYAFSQEGRTIVRNLTSKLLYSGSLVTSVPKLSPGESFEHEVSLTFLYKGHYLLDIKTITPTLHKDTSTKTHPTVESVSKSPVKRGGQRGGSGRQQQRHGPPELPKTPSSVSSSSDPTPPSPGSTSVVSPGPPVQPKSARAIARRFESEFANKKNESVPRPQQYSASQSSSSVATASDDTTLRYISDSNATSSTADTDSTTKATPTTSDEAPPPLPTSSRPVLNRTLSYQLGQASSMTDPKADRSFTTVAKPALLAKPSAVTSSSSKATTDSAPSSTLSSSSKSLPSTSSATPSSPGNSPPGKSRSAVLLSSHSKYQNLLRERSQASGSVRVISGPNFSFYVS